MPAGAALAASLSWWVTSSMPQRVCALRLESTEPGCPRPLPARAGAAMTLTVPLPPQEKAGMPHRTPLKTFSNHNAVKGWVDERATSSCLRQPARQFHPAQKPWASRSSLRAATYVLRPKLIQSLCSAVCEPLDRQQASCGGLRAMNCK